MEDQAKDNSLTERMRSSTKESHDKSDRLVNLKLALVLTSPKLYGESISLFFPIFERLESIIERLKGEEPQSGYAQLKKLKEIMPKLSRTAGFQSDISHYLTSDERKAWRERFDEGNPPELIQYLDHLDTLEKKDPIRILAYIYHLYMAIFAGGFIIQKMVRKTMGIPKDSNIGVEAFGLSQSCIEQNISSKSLRTQLKRLMNEDIGASLSEHEIDSILDESHKVFDMNNKLVSSVQVSPTFETTMKEFKRKFIIPIMLVIPGILLSFLFFRNEKKK